MSGTLQFKTLNDTVAVSLSVNKRNVRLPNKCLLFVSGFFFCIVLVAGANPQSYHLEENCPVWAPGNHQQHKSCEFIRCHHALFSPQSCNPLFTCCTWFQVVYKEVERRPPLVSDDLSPHNITVDSTLLNTHSKCVYLIFSGFEVFSLTWKQSDF